MTEADRDKDSLERMSVSRRRFLVMGSAVAATPLLGLWRAPALGSSTLIHRLLIGYVAGSAELLDGEGPLLADTEGVQVVRASAADGARVTGPARVTAHGIYPSTAGDLLGGKSVDLDVLTREKQGEFSRPVYLWSRRAEPVLSTSAPAGLNVPARSALGLRVTVTKGSESYVAQRSIGRGRVPLRRGIYLLAIGRLSSLSGFGRRPSLMLAVDAQDSDS